jgi:nitroreductase
MDALDLLKTRKSVSTAFLASPGPDAAQLDEILTIASRVPDHGKLAPWRFIVFEGDARARAGDALAALYRKKHPDAEATKIEEERTRFTHAPVVVGVVSRAAPHVKIPEFEQLLAAGNATMMMILAAHAMGFTAQWVTGWITYDPDAARLLGIAPDERFVGFVHIGTSTVPYQDRPRPNLANLVSRWDAPAA